MIVRELLTRIGFTVDRKSEKKAKQTFAKLKNAATSLGAFLATGALAVGFKKTIDAASDVEETMNVVTTAFEDQASAVLDWARVSGEAAGRSEFAMREYAATIGAVVGPTLGSAEATADLSTQMAQLAVDLGSFFNATDQEALDALRAGLIGSSEPLLRFGVNMNVAALDAFALSEGLGKTTKQMSEQEKTMLRFRFIMSRTTKAQGDAEKTSDGFANQMKRLEGNVRNLAVAIGKEALPGAAGFLQSLNAIAKVLIGPISLAFRSVLNVFKFLTTAIAGVAVWIADLGAVWKTVFVGILAAVLAIKAPLVLTWLLIGTAVAGAIAIVEDFWLALTEGRGVLMGLLREFTHWFIESDSMLTAFGQVLKNAVDFWVEVLFGFGSATDEVLDWVGGLWRGWSDLMAWVWSTRVGELIPDGIAMFVELGETVERVINTMVSLFGEVAEAVTNFVTGPGIGQAFELAKGLFGVVGDLDKAAGLVGPERITVPGSPAARAAAATQNVAASQQINVNVNAPGADGPAVASAVAPAVGRAAAEGNRQIGQQLLAGGAS